MTEEQMSLIELHGENGMKIRDAGRSYRSTITRRLKIQEKEATQKADLIDLCKEADLQPVKDETGVKLYRVHIDGVTVEWTHSETDNVKVKVDSE